MQAPIGDFRCQPHSPDQRRQGEPNDDNASAVLILPKPTDAFESYGVAQTSSKPRNMRLARCPHNEAPRLQGSTRIGKSVSTNRHSRTRAIIKQGMLIFGSSVQEFCRSYCQ